MTKVLFAAASLLVLSSMAADAAIAIDGSTASSAGSAGIVLADVQTGYEYRPYCTQPDWQGPWLSYRWNAQEYVDAMIRRGYRGCSIRVRHSSEKWN